MRQEIWSSFALGILCMSSHALAVSASAEQPLPDGFVGVVSGPVTDEVTVYNTCYKSVWVATLQSLSYSCSISSCPPTSWEAKGWWEIRARNKRSFSFSKPTYASSRILLWVEDGSGSNLVTNAWPGVSSCVDNDAFNLKTEGGAPSCGLNGPYLSPKQSGVVIDQCD